MDPHGVATKFASELITHKGKLEGKAGEVQRAQAALESAASAIQEQREAHKQAAGTMLSGWKSDATPGFEKRSEKFDKDLAVTAEASAKGAQIVAEVTKALENRHSTVGNLVEDFIGKAGQLVQAGLAAAGIAAPAGLMKAVAQISDLAGGYIKESGGELKDARDEMTEAAKKLRALLKEVDSDGVADPHKEQTKPSEGGQREKDEKPKEKGKDSAKADDILDNARKHLGYHEGANNQNKWGPTGQPWCSYFATSMWREAGVDIPKYGFTGDVYKWGQEQGTAYNRGDLAGQARPGDALLFGSGPSQGASTHIGIIEKVDGNKITTIEGNSGDQVERRTYTLPKDAGKFYGGVHPK
ncbi:CHAP domain-containing protein [Saccharopolyspora shandongensis]|uniref:CHAP domain-containing protein n=1 Tax=Saccharopolyspora shandongensis TaxID=418495 RepID=A0A1H3TQ69_9PSEU|nr:CHAP domain-containing protein [Saccharopolyspora shandongensis]SDZ52260.1 CHAP domain-containing protein [Saccharopolyspora shandongensis]